VHEPTAGAVYAALDLGTNNCRLLVARPTQDNFRVVDAFSRIIRLGEGLTVSGRISDAAVARAVAALSICRDKMRLRGVSRARLIATEACRAAENGEYFRKRIAEEVGLDLEIVDRGTEAGLAATGCAPLVAPDAEGVILFDIGGGSSELVHLGNVESNGSGPPSAEIKDWISLPIGVVTLAERHGGVTVTRATYEAMVDEVARHLAPFAVAHGRVNLERTHLLGTSGTVTTIAGVHLQLPRYDRRRVDGAWLSRGQISDVTERLLTMDYRDRVANPCIGAERADLVLAGCAILEAIRRAFPCTRLRVADRGLREGMLVKMMREDGVWNSPQVSAP
jgi:exopolyphosphatase/guanosine-5'-triphosphate,3'-diphosphate pyrophosphatase